MPGLTAGASVPATASALHASPANSHPVTLLPGLTDTASSPEIPPQAGETRSRPTLTTAQTDKLIEDVLARHTQSFAALDAFEDLSHGLLLAREKRQEVPCLGPGAEAWTSDDETDQELAADLCLLCPVFTLCQRYADEAKPEAGTWAGVTRDPAKDQTGRLRQRRPGMCVRGLHDVTRPGAVYTSPRGRKECMECRNARQQRGTRRTERQRPPRTGRRWNPGTRECRCGCAGVTKGGNYLPGHDSQHLARLTKEVRGGRSLDDALVEVAHSERLGVKLRAWLGK